MRSNIGYKDRRSRDTTAILCQFILFLALLRVLASYSFFEINISLSLALTAVMAGASMLMVIMEFRKISLKCMIIYGFLVLLLAISYLFNESGLENSCNTILLFSMLLTCPRMHLTRRTIFRFANVYIVLSLLIAIVSAIDRNIINNNTNSTAMILMAGDIICILMARSYGKKQMLRTIYYCIAIIMAVLQLYYKSRATILCTVLIALYFILKNRIDKYGYKAIYRLSVLICVGGTLFAYIYADVLFELFGRGEVLIFGKDLFSGRQTIWHNALETFKENWLLGVGNRLMADDGTVFNAHNQMLGWLVNYGVIAYGCIVFLFAITFRDYSKRLRSKAFVFIFLILMIHSYAETTLYSSGFVPIYMVVANVAIFYDYRMEAEYSKGRSLLKKEFNSRTSIADVSK